MKVKNIRNMCLRISIFLFAVFILSKITGFWEPWVDYTPLLAFMFFVAYLLLYGVKGTPLKKAKSIMYRMGALALLLWIYMVLAGMKYLQMLSLTITSTQVFWAAVFLFGAGFVLGALER
ncbi:MAG TPA: hypothetical protein ENF55_02055 [Thermoprotei archaeon]|nr:hypothetical protein [Thermoprotei archaeon]